MLHGQNVEVEQDLLISRCIVAIFADEFLALQLAFRGGTALHKLYFHPQPRYSEDIDLVQVNSGTIKPILQRLGEVLSFMPDKVIKQKRFNNTLLFRVDSEIPPIAQIRLKIEINCFEHFNELGLVQMPFVVNSPWFTGACRLTTYQLEELLGTKLRALYQRKKGRDLFDLFYALSNSSVDAWLSAYGAKTSAKIRISLPTSGNCTPKFCTRSFPFFFRARIPSAHCHRA